VQVDVVLSGAKGECLRFWFVGGAEGFRVMHGVQGRKWTEGCCGMRRDKDGWGF